MHETGGLQIVLDSLTWLNRGSEVGPKALRRRHWVPVLKLLRDGQPAKGWDEPGYEAEDTSGNRGQLLGWHEPVLRFTVTARPKPEAVAPGAARWQLPPVALPGTNGVYTNASHTFGNSTVKLLGFFAPGTYTFYRGELTNPPGAKVSCYRWCTTSEQVSPGRWVHWRHHASGSNFVAFARFEPTDPDQCLAVTLRDERGQTVWAEPRGSEESIHAFSFTPPAGAQRVALEVVLLEPVRTQFVVKTPLPPP